MRTRSILCCAALAALALPASASAMGTPEGYPRTIAGVGVADGVTVSRTQATLTLLSGNRVRVTVFAVVTTAATGRRLVVAAARCTGSATSPVCRAAASSRISLATGRTTLQRTFTITRPVRPPDALRVLVLVTRTSSAPVPVCGAGARPGAACLADRRFVLGGDLLMAGGTWRHRAGARYGTSVTAPAGTTVSQVFYNSRTYTWTAKAEQATSAVTTIGWPGQPPGRTYTDKLKAGTPRTFDRTPSIGTAFETRSGVRTLTYAASIAGAPAFTMQVPVPAWDNTG